MLCHFLSFLVSGSGINEEVWERGGIGRREGSTGLRYHPGIHIQAVLTQDGKILAAHSSYMRSSGQTEGSGILVWPFPIFGMLSKDLSCLCFSHQQSEDDNSSCFLEMLSGFL